MRGRFKAWIQTSAYVISPIKSKLDQNLKLLETRIYQKHSRKKIHPQGKIDFLPYSLLKLFNELF